MNIEKEFTSAWDVLKKKPMAFSTEKEFLKKFNSCKTFAWMTFKSDGNYLGHAEIGKTKRDDFRLDIRFSYFDSNLNETHGFMLKSIEGTDNILNIYQCFYFESNTITDLIKDKVLERKIDYKNGDVEKFFYNIINIHEKDLEFNLDTIEELFLRFKPYNFNNPPYEIELDESKKSIYYKRK